MITLTKFTGIGFWFTFACSKCFFQNPNFSFIYNRNNAEYYRDPGKRLYVYHIRV